MTLTKERLEARLEGLHNQYKTAQANLQTAQANLEALSGAIQLTRILLEDLEAPEPQVAPEKKDSPRRAKLREVPAPAVEGEVE